MITEHRRKMQRLYSARWRKRNPEKRKEVLRKSYQKHKEKILAYFKKRYKTHKSEIDKRTNKYQKSIAYKLAKNIWCKKNRHKLAAYQAVRRALKKGVLIKSPCVKCGNKESEAHHEDYSKKLDVIWLCKVHHKLQHGWNPTIITS